LDGTGSGFSSECTDSGNAKQAVSKSNRLIVRVNFMMKKGMSGELVSLVCHLSLRSLSAA